MLLRQGEKGLQGPKGNPGPAGLGQKGDKVMLTVTVDCDYKHVNYIEDNMASPVWPSGKHRGSWSTRVDGFTRGRGPRRKGKTSLITDICFPYFSLVHLSVVYPFFLGKSRARWALWSKRAFWIGFSWTKG